MTMGATGGRTSRSNAIGRAASIQRRLQKSAYACVALFGLVISLGVVSMPERAGAHWLTKLLREAGEAGADGAKIAGTKIAKTGIRGLDDAAAVIRKLPDDSSRVAVAAHVTPEGHWKFINKDGDVYTAGTPEELARFTQTVAPEVANGNRTLSLYLSDDAVFERRAMLQDLPADAELHVVFDRKPYRLEKGVGTAADKLGARLKENVVVALGERSVFKELVWQLGRPFSKLDMRVVALKPGGPDRLRAAPGKDAKTGGALVDAFDPAHVAEAFGDLPGQTVMVSGRVDGGRLYYKAAGSSETSIAIDRLTRAANEADVNLVVVHAASSRQPGGRNWLWQKVEVSRLADALREASYGDFLSAIAGPDRRFFVSSSLQQGGRVHISARPLPASGQILAPLEESVSSWFGDIVSEITGEVVMTAIDIHAMDRDRQKERDGRLISWLPAAYQDVFLGGLIAGLLGLGVARRWWARIWPPEARGEYSGAAGFYAARIARLVAFVLIFLPLAGLPALMVTLVVYLFNIIMAPFRFVRRKWRGEVAG